MSKPKRQSLAALMKSSEAAAEAKPRRAMQAVPASQSLVVKSISLTPEAEATLGDLMKAARDRMGRKVSASAIVRALLSLSHRNGLDVVAALEAELNSGAVVWGSRRSS